jgi:hypothetical protein
MLNVIFGAVAKKWLFWFCEGSVPITIGMSGKTKCAVCAAGFFVVCLFVKFCTVVCFLGLPLTVSGLAQWRILEN